MDAIEQLKQDVRQGRVDVDRLIDVIVTLQRQLEAARQRIEELEKKMGGPATPATPATAKVEQPFSMRAEEKRQQVRQEQQTQAVASRPPRPAQQRRQDQTGRADRGVCS